MRIIFLDIDGVLNCELHYKSQNFNNYRDAKKQLRKDVKNERIERLDYYKAQMCSERIGWLNELCKDIQAKVVISSTWRMGKTIDELKEIATYCGGTFDIIDKTPFLMSDDVVRGNEIHKWIKDNESLVGKYYDYKDYVIIDDDSDMLLWQKNNFFQTDSYSGLTPNTCYRIKRFFGQPTFPLLNNEQNVQESDTTDDDSSTKADNQKI